MDKAPEPVEEKHAAPTAREEARREPPAAAPKQTPPPAEMPREAGPRAAARSQARQQAVQDAQVSFPEMAKAKQPLHSPLPERTKAYSPALMVATPREEAKLPGPPEPKEKKPTPLMLTSALSVDKKALETAAPVNKVREAASAAVFESLRPPEKKQAPTPSAIAPVKQSESPKAITPEKSTSPVPQPVQPAAKEPVKQAEAPMPRVAGAPVPSTPREMARTQAPPAQSTPQTQREQPKPTEGQQDIRAKTTPQPAEQKQQQKAQEALQPLTAAKRADAQPMPAEARRSQEVLQPVGQTQKAQEAPQPMPGEARKQQEIPQPVGAQQKPQETPKPVEGRTPREAPQPVAPPTRAEMLTTITAQPMTKSVTPMVRGAEKRKDATKADKGTDIVPAAEPPVSAQPAQSSAGRAARGDEVTRLTEESVLKDYQRDKLTGTAELIMNGVPIGEMKLDLRRT